MLPAILGSVILFGLFCCLILMVIMINTGRILDELWKVSSNLAFVAAIVAKQFNHHSVAVDEKEPWSNPWEDQLD